MVKGKPLAFSGYKINVNNTYYYIFKWQHKEIEIMEMILFKRFHSNFRIKRRKNCC